MRGSQKRRYSELEAKERAIRNARESERNPRHCPNCKSLLIGEGHFFPPSLGEEGFFTCETRQDPIPVDEATRTGGME